MSKEYAFEFFGTKEKFLEVLDQFPGNERRFYYFNDYIVERNGEEIRFGVERCGHSGGNWFIPKITEFGDRVTFVGEIQYIGPEGIRSSGQKVSDTIGVFLLCVLLLPIVLIALICRAVAWCVRKIRGCSKPITTQDRLYDLMEKHSKCKRV